MGRTPHLLVAAGIPSTTTHSNKASHQLVLLGMDSRSTISRAKVVTAVALITWGIPQQVTPNSSRVISATARPGMVVIRAK